MKQLFTYGYWLVAVGFLALSTGARGQCTLFQSARAFGLNGGAGSYSVAVADFNGDGKPDLVTANQLSNTVSVLLGLGQGSFGPATNIMVGDNPQSVAVGDFNGDKKPDVVTARYFNNAVSVLLGNGKGSFDPAINVGVGGFPRSVAVGDFNQDGKTDLVTANMYVNTVSVLLGNGQGSFTPPTIFGAGEFLTSVIVGDLNQDGKPDLVTTNGGNGLSVLLGNGQGGFASPTNFMGGGYLRSVAVGDFNGDGKPDLVTNAVSLLLGLGQGSFAPPTNFGGGRGSMSVAVGDLNQDGKLDLVTTSGDNTVSVLLGNGQGSFAPPTDFGAGGAPFSVAVGDFNGDNKPDLVTANYLSNNVSVLLNGLISITQPLASGLAVCAGAALTTSVSANGTVSAYQWYKDGALLSGQISATLTLTNVQPAQSGSYEVVVSGCNSVTSTPFSLTVNDPPVATLTAAPSALLSCTQTSLTLTAGGGNTYAFSGPGFVSQSGNQATLNVPGSYSVTVTGINGCKALAQATVSGTTDAPTVPTLAAAPAPTTEGQPITVTASGCTGGTITWTALGGTGQASGNTYTLTQPGNYTLSATCSLNGCTSSPSAPLALRILPGGFAITGVSMVNCELFDEAKGGYRVQFTPQYTGQNSSPVSFSVVNELATTTASAPYSLRLYTDNPVIALVAAQAGNGEARFAYNWLASCQSGSSPNRPPTATGIPNQTIVQGQAYQLQLTSYFTDPDWQALTFQALGLPAGLSLTGSVISGTPTQTGLANVMVTALDPGGLQANTSFTLTVSPMLTTPPSGFTIVGVSTVSCQVIGVGERQLTFTPQYAGVSGVPISFSVANELRPTMAAGPYTLRLYTDNPAIMLSAQQGSAGSSYRYNWLAVCNPAGRVGLGEAESALVVRVLGNPLTGDVVAVEVQGAHGQLLQVRLTDLHGQLVSERSIQQAGPVESLRLSIASQPGGLLLLRVSTPTQSQTLKVLKP